jgi:hypothetical protein
MGSSSSGRHLLEIGSLKDSCCWLFFSMKSVACQKKCLPAKKVFACKEAFACKKAFDCKKSVCVQKKH